MSMQISGNPGTEQKPKSLPSNRGMTFVVILLMTIFIISIGLVLTKRDQIESFFSPKWFSDFSTLQVSDGFHKVSIPGGNRWDVAYEADHEVVFQGLVLHNSPIREKGFEILTQDMLVTTGDFSDPNLVYTKVTDHHFVYRSLAKPEISGTINLLHTVPMNEEIDQLLQEVKSGDEVIIKGWEILNLKSWNSEGTFIGTWQDAGCNTTLITQVVINPGK
jgi:hypothetical protein